MVMLKVVDAIIPSTLELTCHHEATLQEWGGTLSSKKHNGHKKNNSDSNANVRQGFGCMFLHIVSQH